MELSVINGWDQVEDLGKGVLRHLLTCIRNVRRGRWVFWVNVETTRVLPWKCDTLTVDRANGTAVCFCLLKLFDFGDTAKAATPFMLSHDWIYYTVSERPMLPVSNPHP